MVQKFTMKNDFITNKFNKQIGKELRITPNKGYKLSIFELNKVYKKILESNNPNKILIRAMTIDGMKTLKTFNYLEDDLSHTLDDYYSSLPKEKRAKFKKLQDVYITIKF
jgi:hypothetical protein